MSGDRNSVLSRYLDNYDESHWQAVKCIFRYLRGTSDFGLLFQSKDELFSNIEHACVGPTVLYIDNQCANKMFYKFTQETILR